MAAPGFMEKHKSVAGKLTSYDFINVWESYDKDGNGFIEGSELDAFLRELIVTSGTPKDSVTDSSIKEIKKSFLETFDKNRDGKINMEELAQILPTDEEFLLIFRQKEPLRSSVEFMEIWRKYDADKSGFIESIELKSFLSDLFVKEEKSISDEKIEEYTKTMLKLFDSNNDGKLEIKEMARILPVKENFLMRFEGLSATLKNPLQGKNKLTKKDFEKVFAHYDKDGNGTIEGDELNGFLKDLMEQENETIDMKGIKESAQALLEICDVNRDGKIQKDELCMIICA